MKFMYPTNWSSLVKKLLALTVALTLIAAWAVALLASGPAAGASTPASPTHVRATTSVVVPPNDRLRPGMQLRLPTTYRGHRIRHYQWLRCNRTGRRCFLIHGATHRVYTVRLADVGHSLRALISPWQGSTAVVTAPTTTVGRPLPVATTLPTLSDDCASKATGCLSDPTATGAVVSAGTSTSPGDDLTGTNGTWQHAVRFTYQWFDCAPSGTTPPSTWTSPVTLDGLTCNAITGATANTYTLVDPNDVGFDIVFQVTAYNF